MTSEVFIDVPTGNHKRNRSTRSAVASVSAYEIFIVPARVFVQPIVTAVVYSSDAEDKALGQFVAIAKLTQNRRIVYWAEMRGRRRVTHRDFTRIDTRILNQITDHGL